MKIEPGDCFGTYKKSDGACGECELMKFCKKHVEDDAVLRIEDERKGERDT